MISADNVFALSGILLGFAWLGFWADTNAIGRKTSGALWTIVGALALSNFGVIPFSAPTYDFVGGTLVPLAIPLLLFKADLRRIFKESGPVMLTFCIASVATALGAIVGFYLLDLGEVGPKVAGVYTAGWTGGSVNFVAVSRAVEMTPDEFSVAIGANSVVSIMALMTLIALPSVAFIRRRIPSRIIEEAEQNRDADTGQAEETPLRLTHVSGALALSFLICWAADSIALTLGTPQYSILFITTIAIAVANMAPGVLRNLKGEFDLGMLIMYVFFAAVGAGTNATSFIDAALILFVYSVLIIVVHLIFVLLVAKLFKLDLAEAITGSAAAIVGPAPTVAIAISRNWRSLVTPGLMCGIFGYAIANFIGVGVTALLD